jgi:hypothetical protein
MTDKLPEITGVLCAVEGSDTQGPARRRQRKPSVGKMIAQAEKTGRNVTSITTPEGYTIRFGEPTTEAENPWLADIEKQSKQ